MENRQIDYRALLIKYILLVGELEGVNFINNCKVDDPVGYAEFTQEEVDEMNKIDREITKTYFS